MKAKKVSLVVLYLLATQFVAAQSLRSVLLDQLKTTHDKQNWFVPVNVALQGVSAEQAAWTDGTGNHSIGQLANHLLFWNERQLQKFKGEEPVPFTGNNDETFNAFTKEQWSQTVKKLSSVLTDLEKIIASADDDALRSWAETIGNISAHNAYHTGQIVYVRKAQGSWPPDKGVK